jgi:hypothetical protein
LYKYMQKNNRDQTRRWAHLLESLEAWYDRIYTS